MIWVLYKTNFMKSSVQSSKRREFAQNVYMVRQNKVAKYALHKHFAITTGGKGAAVTVAQSSKKYTFP